MKYVTKMILFVLAMLALATPAKAIPIIADLSLRTIEIDSGFTGTDILLFGARNDVGNIVIVVRGPKKSFVVRKKEKMAGIWVNNDYVQFNNVDGFYAVASSRPLEQIAKDKNLLLDQLAIGYEHIYLEEASGTGLDQKIDFEHAFKESLRKDRLYEPEVGEVIFLGDTLFRSIIRFPEKIPRGTYLAEVYLFDDGQLSGMQSIPLLVNKKGFDAFIFDLAYNYPALYGLLAICLALLAGWIAGVVFRKVVS